MKGMDRMDGMDGAPETFTPPGQVARAASPAGLVSGWLEAAAEEARRLPAEQPGCIEQTFGKDTGKGYDTTGIRLVWLWEVLIRHVPAPMLLPGRMDVFCEREERTGKSGPRTVFNASMVVTLKIMGPDASGEVLCETSAFGGHVAKERGDALRGAETAGLKRCLANWGIGIEAYKGTLEKVQGSKAHTPSGSAGHPSGEGNQRQASPAEMDDRRLLLAVKKRAATLLREEKKDLAAMLLSVADDAWDFARLNKLQPGDLTPELRQSLQDMLTVMA